MGRKISEYSLKKFAWTSCRNFSERYSKKFVSYNESEMEHFCIVLKELSDIKESLIQSTLDTRMISYKTPKGLGAICITCVEEYVTPVLTKHGFSSKIIARQFPFLKTNDQVSYPPIHTYTIVRLCGTDLIIDIDADPFAGMNTGIFITPYETKLRIYNSGIIYHERSINLDGEIESFSFRYLDDTKGIITYAFGNYIDSLSIVSYHNESNNNYCPIWIVKNFILYFSYDKCYTENKSLHQIRIVIVCPVNNDTTRSLQINLYHVKSFYINHIEHSNPIVSSVVIIEFVSGRKIEVLVSKDGSIIENNFFHYQNDKLGDYGGNIIVYKDDKKKEIIIIPGESDKIRV